MSWKLHLLRVNFVLELKKVSRCELKWMGAGNCSWKDQKFLYTNPGSHNMNRNQLQLVYVLYNTCAMASVPALYCLIIYVPCSYKQQKELGKLKQTILTSSIHWVTTNNIPELESDDSDFCAAPCPCTCTFFFGDEFVWYCLQTSRIVGDPFASGL